MERHEIVDRCRCGACGRRMIESKHINVCQLNKWAVWEHPTHANVLTGEQHRACAVMCDSCVADERPPVEAVEFVNDSWVVYHPLESLHDAPPPQSYVILRNDRGDPGIECLHCGLVSWNINDVDYRYCGHCRKFHNF